MNFNSTRRMFALRFASVFSALGSYFRSISDSRVAGLAAGGGRNP